MRRGVPATLILLTLASAAVADDNGSHLVNLFTKTCGVEPSLPSEMERIALALNFISDGGPVSPAMESGPTIDILYSARSADGNFGLTAYFEGPVENPTITCTLSTAGVSPETLPGLVETSLKVRGRREENAGSRHRASWSMGDDTLRMSAHADEPRRASVEIEYHGHKP